MRKRERDRQTERGTERERPQREEGEGLKGPQASSNLWHGKKEELALSVSVCVCVHTHQRGRQEDIQHPSSVSLSTQLCY